MFMSRASSPGAGGSDYATIKYSPSGQRFWVARYNGLGDYTDEASDVAVDAAALSAGLYLVRRQSGQQVQQRVLIQK